MRSNRKVRRDRTQCLGDKMRKSLTSAAVLFGLSASLVVGATLPAIAATTLVGNGSSFQDDFQQKCITKFNADNKTGGGKKLNISATYSKSSSGEGRAALNGGTAVFAGADSTGEEISVANSVYIPIAAAPVAFFFNLKTAKGAAVTGLNLDSLTLSKIFRGDIRYWDDSAIKGQNKAVALPHNSISVQYRSGDSGTSKNMFKFFNATAAANSWGTSDGYWATQNKGTVVGTSNNGGSALVDNVVATDNSIGYADLSDVDSSLKLVALKNAKGAYVKPTAAAATAFLKGAGVLTENGTYSGTYAIDWTTQVTGAYQFTILTYMVGSKANTPNNDLKAYATYMIKNCSSNPAGIGAPGFVTPGATVLSKATAQIAKL